MSLLEITANLVTAASISLMERVEAVVQSIAARHQADQLAGWSST